MGQYTLTKYEKRLVDKAILNGVDKGVYQKFDIPTFNHALCTTMPQWRVEELTKGQNSRNIAYIDYVKDFYRIKYK